VPHQGTGRGLGTLMWKWCPDSACPMPPAYQGMKQQYLAGFTGLAPNRCQIPRAGTATNARCPSHAVARLQGTQPNPPATALVISNRAAGRHLAARLGLSPVLFQKVPTSGCSSRPPQSGSTIDPFYERLFRRQFSCGSDDGSALRERGSGAHPRTITRERNRTPCAPMPQVAV